MVVGEGEEGAGHPHRATLQVNEARQGMGMKGRMGERCFLLCFRMGRPERRGLTEGEDTHTGETTNTVERNENQELASPLGLGQESHTCLKTLNLCPRMEISRLGEKQAQA